MSESVKIIENGLVVTCDAQGHVGTFALLVKDDQIAEVNPNAAGLKARYPQAEVIDASEKIIFPGFVDAHYHGESFVLRNWTAGVPASKWHKYPAVRKAISFVHREATKDELAPMYRTAYFSALKSGITTISEFGFDNLDGPFLAACEAMKRSDLKGFVGIHNGEQADRARVQPHASVHYAFVLPNEDDLTVYSLQTALRLASETHWPIISHLGESRKGLETTKRNFHRSIVRVLEEYKVLLQPVHLAHLVSLEEGDDVVLSRMHIPVILNPTSILSKNTDLPSLPKLIENGIPLALCSDWGAPDPFENMRSMRLLARLCGADPISPQELILMHTLQGARALHVQQDIGSVEGGKKADLTFLDVSDLRSALPLALGNITALLERVIQDAGARHVSDVMINGEFFLRKGQVMTYAEEDLKREYRDAVKRISEKTEIRQEEPAPETIAHSETPIIPLHNPQPQSPVSSGDEPFEEGFRIVGTTGSLQQRPRKEVERAKPPEEKDPPPEVRRVFGEDDF
ncbi:MAG: amidohydrolase family protein [Bacteroidota bacterium]